MPSTVYINTVLDGTTTTVQGGPILLDMGGMQSWSFGHHWNQLAADGQTLAATLTWEITSDPQVRGDVRNGTTNANWITISGSTSPSLTYTDPTSGAGEEMVNGSFSGWLAIRCLATRSSGSGRYESFFNYVL